MSPPSLTVTFDARDPARQTRFWTGLLRRDPAGDDTQVGLRFVPEDSRTPAQDTLHLHLTSADPAQQQETVARALALGASHLDVGQRPEEGHIVLADPEGNAFCVIEPGNNYLAGTGFLGEVACDGSRAVGLFWSEALGWPLVWDQDEETAIQSPGGGTKVAWGGPSADARTGRNRQRFELPAGDVDRLIALGATRLGSGPEGVELADPDGNEFTVRAP
jgi:catechol 2,3-dioxygenase-like lactoylglutathione lyase family enzyme